MVLNLAKIVRRQRKRRSKNGGRKIIFFKNVFRTLKKFLFYFFLVSGVNLFEVYDKKVISRHIVLMH
jgi:hypothetical protein